MAFGFSPKYKQEINLNNFGKEHFLTLAIEAANKLEWNISFISETGFIAFTNFSFSSWSEEITVKVENENIIIKSECTGSQLFDWGKNKENVKSLIAKVEKLKEEITEEEIDIKINELRQHYVNKEQDVLNKPPSTNKEKISSILSIFKPVEGYFVSPILININIIVFILMILSGVHFMTPEVQDLLNWGANFRPLTLDGQLWRLFSACFLHIGVFHLLLNMYALLYIGLILEPYLGKVRFLTAYIISGIAASITSLMWHDITVSAGASGAIFGMYGVFLAMLTTNLLDKSVKKAMLTSIVVFVGYNILNGFNANSGIDNAAHIGGLFSGLLIGYAFVPSLKKFNNNKLKYTTIGALLIVLIMFLFTAYRIIPNDIGTYDAKMKEFAEMEVKALEIYNLPETLPKEKILSEIETIGLYYWRENLKLVESLSTLDLPFSIRARNTQLKEYCELRIKSYELIYKAIEEDTNKYEQELIEYNKKIEKIINSLIRN